MPTRPGYPLLTAYSQLALLLLVLSMAIQSCTAPVTPTPPPDVRQLVGALHNSDAYIGLAISGQAAIGYVTDGTSDKATLNEWFRGSVTGNTALLSSISGATLRAELGATGASGTLHLADGRDLTFTVTPPIGKAGLYYADDPMNFGDIVWGWVALNEQQQRGAVARYPATSGPEPPSGVALNLDKLTVDTSVGSATLLNDPYYFHYFFLNGPFPRPTATPATTQPPVHLTGHRLWRPHPLIRRPIRWLPSHSIPILIPPTPCQTGMECGMERLVQRTRAISPLCALMRPWLRMSKPFS